MPGRCHGGRSRCVLCTKAAEDRAALIMLCNLRTGLEMLKRYSVYVSAWLIPPSQQVSSKLRHRLLRKRLSGNNRFQPLELVACTSNE
eukprot:1348322-Pleurochrysis_carterae.AAC.1